MYDVTPEEQEAIISMDREELDHVAEGLLGKLSVEGPDPVGLKVNGEVIQELLRTITAEILNMDADNIGGVTHKDSWKGET